MGCYLFVLYAIAGKPPSGLEQKYILMQALLTGAVTIAAVGPFCSKLPRHFDVTSAAVLGLLEWWIEGLQLAVPNAVATAIAVVQMRPVRATPAGGAGLGR